MHCLKLTAAAVLMSSGLAFAGSMGPVCTPGNLTVPCAQNAWGFNANALYLQPSYSGVLGYLGSTDTELANSSWVRNKPDWSWGFEIGTSYYFNTGNDASLNWYHLSSPSTSYSALYTFGVPLAQRSYESDLASIHPSWDAVNFEVGQIVKMSARNVMRLHAGAQYSRIASSLSHLGNEALALGGGDYDTEEMQYSGFGPRLGAELAYFMTSDFSVYAKSATALLFGTSKTNSTRGNLVFPPPTVIYLNRTQVVPEVDLKLGLQYDYALSNSKLSADLGYMWVNYFSPISQLNPFFNNFDSSNFTLQGLYFGLKWLAPV